MNTLSCMLCYAPCIFYTILFNYIYVHIHVAANWVTPLTHRPNKRKCTSQPVAHFDIVLRKHVVQPGNWTKTVHSFFKTE